MAKKKETERKKCERGVKKIQQNPAMTSWEALERLELPHFLICNVEVIMRVTSQGFL